MIVACSDYGKLTAQMVAMAGRAGRIFVVTETHQGLERAVTVNAVKFVDRHRITH
jgi:hypothetical protein